MAISEWKVNYGHPVMRLLDGCKDTEDNRKTILAYHKERTNWYFHIPTHAIVYRSCIKTLDEFYKPAPFVDAGQECAYCGETHDEEDSE